MKIGVILAVVLLITVSECKVHHSQMTAHLPVRQNEYVSVFVGAVPGRLLTLRIDKEQNETIVLFKFPDSKAFIRYGETAEGEDLVYIGCHFMHLALTIDPSKNAQSTMAYDGILGLGADSQLWRYWSKYSLSSSDLVLGTHDHFIERRKFKEFQLSIRGREPMYTDLPITFNGLSIMTRQRRIKVSFRPEEPHTRVPSDIYFRLVNSSDPLFEIHLLATDKRTVKVEIRGNAFRRHSESDEIVLGYDACHNFVWHTDLLSGVHLISPSYDLFDTGNSQPTFTIVSAVLFVLYYYFWYSIAYVETKAKNGDARSLALSVIEVVGYVTCALFCYIMVVGYKVERFMIFQIAGGDGFWLGLFWALVCTIPVGLLLTSVNWNTPRSLTVRKALFEFVLVCCFWLTQLQTHYTGLQQMFLVALASLHCVSRSTIALWWFIEKIGKLKTFVLATSALISHIFLIFYNILPFVQRYWYGFPAQWSSIVLVWLTTAGIPTFLIFFGLVNSEIANDLIKLK